MAGRALQIRQWLWSVLLLFDRRGGRWLLGLVAAIRNTIAKRSVCRVRYSRGLWLHRYNNGVVPSISLTRDSPADFEDQTIRDFFPAYKPKFGDVVLDIGAGMGTEVLALSRAVGPSGRVLAFEAHPRTFSVLRRLCDVNRLTNVEALNVAVGDRAGVMRITDLDEWASNSLLLTAREPDDGIAVPVETIDSCLEARGIERVDFLKMNIEGAERLAMLGMLNSIAHIHHMVICCHDFIADTTGPEEMRTKGFVHDFLVEHGFDVGTWDNPPDPAYRDMLFAAHAKTKSCPVCTDLPASVRFPRIVPSP